MKDGGICPKFDNLSKKINTLGTYTLKKMSFFWTFWLLDIPILDNVDWTFSSCVDLDAEQDKKLSILDFFQKAPQKRFL